MSVNNIVDRLSAFATFVGAGANTLLLYTWPDNYVGWATVYVTARDPSSANGAIWRITTGFMRYAGGAVQQMASLPQTGSIGTNALLWMVTVSTSGNNVVVKGDNGANGGSVDWTCQLELNSEVG